MTKPILGLSILALLLSSCSVLNSSSIEDTQPTSSISESSTDIESESTTTATSSSESSEIQELEEYPTGEFYEDDESFYVIENRSEVYRSIENSWGDGCSYPSIIELQHSKNANGTLLAAYTISNSGLGFGPTWLSVAKSTDRGDTWRDVARVYETVDTTLEACWNPCLLELPCKVGKYEAGTILLAGVSVDARQEVMAQIALWASEDLGETWEEISIIVETDIQHGVWEPHLIFEDGYLYCFFADDRGDGERTHDQTIAYNRSSDLLNWEKTVGVVYGQTVRSRPGMPVVTKMGNGKYFLVFEYGLDGATNGVPIYTKTSRSIDRWGKYDDGELLLSTDESQGGSSPFCIWFPAGGECGTLLVTCKYGSNKDNKIFVSHDYGKTFNLIPNFLPYDNRGSLGYHPSFFFSQDGKTLYYLNTTDYSTEKGRIQFARIHVQEKRNTKQYN